MIALLISYAEGCPGSGNIQGVIMPQPDTVKLKPPLNLKLRAAREALASPSGLPGTCMSRRELAEAANAHVWQHTNGRQQTNLSERDIGRYERYEARWPDHWRRLGLRGVLGVDNDADLGFYPTRKIRTTPATAGNGTCGLDDANNQVSPGVAGGSQRVRQPSDVLPVQPGPVDDQSMQRRNFLAAGGTIAADALLSGPARVVEALGVVTTDGADTFAAAVDHLEELVGYYSEAVCLLASARLYDEMVGVRSYASSLQARAGGHRPRHRSELIVTAGWLSNLLAVAASYRGEHAAALVWCADAEHRSHEAGHPELAGWAALIRAMVAFYQGRAGWSVECVISGQRFAPVGTVVSAKLPAQEMRARAMLGDRAGTAHAKRRAATAMEALPAATARSGAFSTPLAEDPPYTATSLLLVGEFEPAAAATGRVLEAAYHGPANYQGRQTSSYARTLMILALAEAGLGRAAEAASHGMAALAATPPVWPTMVLADRLDQVLAGRFGQVGEVHDYHDRYAAAGHLPRQPDLLGSPV